MFKKAAELRDLLCKVTIKDAAYTAAFTGGQGLGNAVMEYLESEC